MQAFQTIRLVLSLLPMILDVVRAIEAALPEGGNGAEKLALVRETIAAGYAIATDAVASFETVWPALEKTVAAAVALFNATGAFRSSR